MRQSLKEEAVTPAILLPGAEKGKLEKIQVLVDAIDEPYKVVADAYNHNLTVVVASLALPFEFGHASARRAAMQRLLIAERIRASCLEGKSEKEQHEAAAKIAKQRMNDETKSIDGSVKLAYEVISYLSEVLEDPQAQASAQHLLEQGIVSTWSTLEVLCRDFFECHLNRNPQLVVMLQKGERKRLDIERISLELLSEYDFNVANRMGTMVVQQHDFSNLSLIRSLYEAIFPKSKAIHVALKQSALWVLYKRRNLLVHRRGVADKKYIEETGERMSIGEKLVIRPEDARAAVILAAEVGSAILRKAPKATR